MAILHRPGIKLKCSPGSVHPNTLKKPHGRSDAMSGTEAMPVETLMRTPSIYKETSTRDGFQSSILH